ncbi:TIR domain-containing protein [Mammaliicoccus sciuri]|uniref:TIR domain-containing protein n=2 Tax=Mammaliicoccus sciuri TaxID=1296 RepID=UPI001F543C24|nr:TIR domain-containing protein [Mammaliicoccus sciuri]
MERQQTYKEKAQHLYKVKGIKNRYNTKSAKEYFFSISQVKNILSAERRKKHKEHYVASEVKIKKAALEKKRKYKNREIEERIIEAKRYTQKIDPEYLNIYMNAYHKKGITIEEKLEILTELKKFDTENVVRFFRKLNDAEQNNMIRNLAFKYLQGYGHYAKLRKNFKGKKKVYQTERASLYTKKPEDLYNDLINKNIQSQKVYDIFISHSTKDKKEVEEIIKIFNEQNKTCYCDWTMDQDYLKRNYVSEYTKQVLKARMEQSKMLVLLKSENSVQSDWVSFEIEYFKKLKKPIYVIESIEDLLEVY